MESQQDTFLSSHAEKVALALAIVKSKPADSSTQRTVSTLYHKSCLYLRTNPEYILQLRRNIQKGYRQLSTPTLHRYVNAVTFWKDCCERSKEEQAELRLRIEELERTDNASTGKLKRRKVASYNPRKKQKKGTDSAITATRKPTGLAEENQPNGYDVAVEFAEKEGYGDASEDVLFMRGLYGYCQMLHDENPDPEKLSSRLVWLSSAIARIISSACDLSHGLNSSKDTSAASEAPKGDHHPSATSTSNLAFGTRCRALSRAFTLLIQGFDRLNHGTQNTVYHGQMTYSLVKLFGEILDGVRKVSVWISHARVEKVLRTHGDRLEHHKETELSTAETTDQEPDLRVHLCRMLIAILAQVHATQFGHTKSGHSNLSDGFLYLLLQRAGQRLHFFVFGDEPNPQNAKPNDHDYLQSCGIEAVKKRAMREEAKYLIWTLKRAMTIVHGRPNESSESASSPKEPDKTSLAAGVRTRYQYTLLQGVFGTDVEEFSGGLSMPAVVEVGVDVDLPTVSEDDTAEWFKQEMWVLCGWEVLGGHLDLSP